MLIKKKIFYRLLQMQRVFFYNSPAHDRIFGYLTLNELNESAFTAITPLSI